MAKIKYYALQDSNLNALNHRVNEQLEAGWLPIGGIATVSYKTGSPKNGYLVQFYYSQALVKEIP